jgi:hypothetical protein
MVDFDTQVIAMRRTPQHMQSDQQHQLSEAVHPNLTSAIDLKPDGSAAKKMTQNMDCQSLIDSMFSLSRELGS